MVKRCRFCGGKIQVETIECPHCNKTLKAQAESPDKGITNIQSWDSKRVPAWVMYLDIAAAIAVFVLMVIKAM